MTDTTLNESIRRTYLRFAENEARGVSPTYEGFALAVTQSGDVQDMLATVPKIKRQPNLLFAAVRHLFGIAPSPAAFVKLVQNKADAVRTVMLSRRTQTNEPARCAVLLPVLSRLPQPLALLEVGASAGLCLLPEHYGYQYNDGPQLGPRGIDVPVFTCQANAATPIPTRLPQVTWRAGLDLNPIDVNNDADIAWLETLIWPEQAARAQRFRAAVKLAKANPPRLVQGDLLTHLEQLAGSAPKDATLVIFHTAVLAYITDVALREQYAQQVATLNASCQKVVWVSNEAPFVFPSIAAKLAKPPPSGRFLLAVDGNPVAATGPHGHSVDWF
ncbi:MAG: DUF2332 domain-containing protein [Chromatiales bacterium]|jgi:hypothetical protein|nr:DUF2332 domain-containing protein [Chromatiales bacterium]